MGVRQSIFGIKYHPEAEGALLTYGFGAPEGEWVGRLDDRAWGNASNLFCYFREPDTGCQWRLSVWSRCSYRPYQGGPAFDQEPLGRLYSIRTANSKAGLPKFLWACAVTEADLQTEFSNAARFS